jgi:cation transport ATPase
LPHDRTVNSRTLQWIALALLAALLFVTLAPIDFRPVSGASPQIERFVAVWLVGLVFAVAWPRHFWLAAVALIACVVLSELLQELVPTRHRRALDAIVKLTGGAIGLTLGRMIWLLRPGR